MRLKVISDALSAAAIKVSLWDRAITRLLGLRSGDTIARVLGRNNGVGPSFDYLRLILASLLLLAHAKWVGAATSFGLMFIHLEAAHGIGTATAVQLHWVGFTKPILRGLVPAFFALSGFLVLGSAFRVRATSTFLAHRALRIIPALLAEVTLSALILGPLLTKLPMHDYFTNPEFSRYFGNVFGRISFVLPGLFEDNPVPRAVNINLWTLPSEFYCYLITAALLLTKIIYDKSLFAVVFAVVTVGLVLAQLLIGVSISNGPFPSHVIVYYFFVGALFYHFKEAIPAHPGIFIAALAVAYSALMYDGLVYLAPIPLTYCTVFFGLIRLPTIRLIFTGDYSYGIYLYGFPISQTYMSIFPAFRDHIFMFLLTTAGTTFVFAALSWHLIERRALGLKRRLPHALFPVGGTPTRTT